MKNHNQLQETQKLLQLTLSDIQLYQDEHKKYLRDNKIFEESRTRFLAKMDDLQKLLNAQEMAKNYVTDVIEHIYQNYTKANIGKEYDSKIKNLFGNIGLALRDPEKAKTALTKLKTDIHDKKTSKTTKKILATVLDQLKGNQEEVALIQKEVTESERSPDTPLPSLQGIDPTDVVKYEKMAEMYKHRIDFQRVKQQHKYQLAKKQMQNKRLEKYMNAIGRSFNYFIGIVMLALVLYVVLCFGKSLKETMGDLETVLNYENFMVPTQYDENGYLSKSMTTYYAYLFGSVNIPIKMLTGALGSTVKVTADFIYNLLLLLTVLFSAILYVPFVKILETKEITLPGGFSAKFGNSPVLQQQKKDKKPQGIPKMIKPLPVPAIKNVQQTQKQRSKMQQIDD